MSSSDLHTCLLAVLESPGDEVARFALADLLEEQGQTEQTGPLRGPGHWEVDWVVAEGQYAVLWWATPPGQTAETTPLRVSLVRRRQAPRCVWCRALQVRATENSGWQWGCTYCLPVLEASNPRPAAPPTARPPGAPAAEAPRPRRSRRRRAATPAPAPVVLPDQQGALLGCLLLVALVWFVVSGVSSLIRWLFF